MLLYVEDDEQAMRTGLRLIASRFGVQAVKSATEALEKLSQTLPSAALIDVELPEGPFAGLELLRTLRARSPLLPAAIITGRLDAVVVNAALLLDADVIGKPAGVEVFAKFLMKVPTTVPGVDDALARARSRYKLTEREVEIAAWVGAGNQVKTFAAHAGIEPSTVKTHVKNLNLKTGDPSVRAFIERIREEER